MPGVVHLTIGERQTNGNLAVELLSGRFWHSEGNTHRHWKWHRPSGTFKLNWQNSNLQIIVLLEFRFSQMETLCCRTRENCPIWKMILKQDNISDRASTTVLNVQPQNMHANPGVNHASADSRLTNIASNINISINTSSTEIKRQYSRLNQSPPSISHPRHSRNASLNKDALVVLTRRRHQIFITASLPAAPKSSVPVHADPALPKSPEPPSQPK